jgi:hypothetical protein
MAYDQFLLDVRRVKPNVLRWAATEKVVAIFEHDPDVKAAMLNVNEKDAVTLGERVEFPQRWED